MTNQISLASWLTPFVTSPDATLEMLKQFYISTGLHPAIQNPKIDENSLEDQDFTWISYQGKRLTYLSHLTYFVINPTASLWEENSFSRMNGIGSVAQRWKSSVGELDLLGCHSLERSWEEAALLTNLMGSEARLPSMTVCNAYSPNFALLCLLVLPSTPMYMARPFRKWLQEDQKCSITSLHPFKVPEIGQAMGF